MSYTYELHPAIDLHVKGRISKADARRQAITARVILQRLEQRPGLILADEVGMGKTFVALAAAASVALEDDSKRPVVVMVPPSLREKWPKDFYLFRERCIESQRIRNLLTAKSADNAIQFLKLLDDAALHRVSVIFLTHGAMSPARKLQDGWVKLAMIRRALHRRRESDALKNALCRHMGDLLRMPHVSQRCPDIWEKLLEQDPRNWLDALRENDLTPQDNDDPVPHAVIEAIEATDFDELYGVLKGKIPFRQSATFKERLVEARERLNQEVSKLWDHCIRSLNIKLPLLVLDEAHHLKNPGTQLASLFRTRDAKADADELAKGPLAAVFERMLFLTATPFQLGHSELCSVLERFEGISWEGSRQPSVGKHAYRRDIQALRDRMDAAQQSAVQLDYLWGRLKREDFMAGGHIFDDVETWWVAAKKSSLLTPTGHQIVELYDRTRERMKAAELALQPYLIRHARAKNLDNGGKKIPRRLRYAGRAILDSNPGTLPPGLDVQGEALLPFLLAARVTSLRPEKRPVFAEGLASSYEAFLHTRMQRQARVHGQEGKNVVDGDDEPFDRSEEDSTTRWYLDQLEASLLGPQRSAPAIHPKIEATVKKTVDLWLKGEKVLIFCHYLKTGKALEEQVNDALDREIHKRVSGSLKCTYAAAAEELENFGRRFFREDSPVRRATDQATESLLASHPDLAEHTEALKSIVRRYLRTPSFLVRFFPLAIKQRFSEKDIFEAFQRKDASGMTIERLLGNFFDFLVKHCGVEERLRYIQALDAIQTDASGKVRLANGTTPQVIRQRLMLTFNTPFYPEVLVASMIMAEGVDLHLNCRHIIHHDLCWNPSTLEQRTGRIDRIGAKVERCMKSVEVYLPYIAKTQDEKMFRVVMDRERWFKVVMGERYKMDARTTEKMAERILLPEEAAEAMAFDLSVCR